jgi:3-oxoacyl-[acyl-carrier protein] reductase
MDLKNTVSIVTGGSGGLGGRICHALANQGSHLAITYNTRPEKADGIAAEVRSRGVEAETYRCDVTSPQQVGKVVSSVEQRFGRIDSLINDAAYNKWIPFPELDKMTLDEWDKMIAINLTGPMMFIKDVAGPMKAQGSGRIVNISSVAGMIPRGSSIGYAVSKAGLNHLTRCMAVALAPEIQVNCIAPGYLEGTLMSENLSPDFREDAKQAAVLKRAADKDDVADQVVAFCRTDSVTGQTLVIDAGRHFN